MTVTTARAKKKKKKSLCEFEARWSSFFPPSTTQNANCSASEGLQGIYKWKYILCAFVCLCVCSLTFWTCKCSSLTFSCKRIRFFRRFLRWKEMHRGRLIPELCSRPMEEFMLVEIKRRIRRWGETGGRGAGGWDEWFTGGLFYSDRAGAAQKMLRVRRSERVLWNGSLRPRPPLPAPEW